jgi:hypothetical protein
LLASLTAATEAQLAQISRALFSSADIPVIRRPNDALESCLLFRSD